MENQTTDTPCPHQVYREDDNGVRILVGTFLDKRSAQRQIDTLEAGHHKQFYWIQAVERELSQTSLDRDAQ